MLQAAIFLMVVLIVWAFWIWYKDYQKNLPAEEVEIPVTNYYSPVWKTPYRVKVPDNLREVEASNVMKGRYYVCFKEPDFPHENDPLIATIRPYKGRLHIAWDNGIVDKPEHRWTAVIAPEHILTFVKK